MRYRVRHYSLMACLLGWVGLALAAPAPRPFVAGTMGQLLTAEPDRARVIVFWSLECSYCQEELQWLAGRDGSEAEVVLVATDPVTSAEAVSTRLRKYGFEPARHWIFAEAFVERLRYDVDPGWGGELPRTYLVAAGEEPIGVSGRLDRERFDAWLQSVTGD